MKASQLAKWVGVTTETVRFYTRQGLLSPHRDPANGYHVYNGEDKRQLSFILRARTLGFSLKEIKQILQHAKQGDSPCPMVRDLLAQHIPQVKQQIAELSALLVRMETALDQWMALPDGVPNGDSVCQLIDHWYHED
ncbi:MerR family transcriptional regulator [Zooshikella harenae]|uniref:MerR family DNA-binding protein n=1 Tax=Zooshikella harenae TaxID=2827238 RepID=A0ABS5ZC87_9GAMM|nr:MerR family DNA-binding protein [Zooshikella harenae]MBU2711378.1 MerR family DNA-binding protein [Zooshikella harenae]